MTLSSNIRGGGFGFDLLEFPAVDNTENFIILSATPGVTVVDLGNGTGSFQTVLDLTAEKAGYLTGLIINTTAVATSTVKVTFDGRVVTKTLSHSNTGFYLIGNWTKSGSNPFLAGPEWCKFDSSLKIEFQGTVEASPYTMGYHVARRSI